LNIILLLVKIARLSSSFDDIFGSIAPCLTTTATLTEPMVVPDSLITWPDFSNFETIKSGAIIMSELHSSESMALVISGAVANIIRTDISEFFLKNSIHLLTPNLGAPALIILITLLDN
jgi:hypothetical protein